MNCPDLTRLAWHGSHRVINLAGKKNTNFTDLRLDDSTLLALDVSNRDPEDLKRAFGTEQSGGGDPNLYVHISQLGRLSMESVSWETLSSRILRQLESFPITQEMIVNRVWHHPILRFLRSDLTEKMTAMLKLEQPEITFYLRIILD